MNSWRLQLFGGLKAVSEGQVVTHFQTRKAALLLAKLALNMERTCSRDELIETLWPEEFLDAARERFRQTLSSLRKALTLEDEEPPIDSDRLTVRLDSSRVDCDVLEFDRALKAAKRDLPIEERIRSLEGAIVLYEGPLLQGYSEEWILAERAAYEASHIEAQGKLAALYAESGDINAAIAQARRSVDSDPLREESRQALIGLLGRAGRASEAVRQFKEYESLILRELGAKPSRSLAHLVAEVQSGSLEEEHAANVPSVGSATPAIAPALEPKAPSVPRPSSPPIEVPLTRFFGREEELAKLEEWVGPSSIGDSSHDPVRLVTLTGPGGCGKTRLALQFARSALASGTELVCFTPLVGLRTASSIVEAIRERLHLKAGSDVDALESALAVFRTGPSLLVLDNFEHLVDDGAPIVEQLLRAAPELRIVVTSRRRLGIWAEQDLPVPPLPTPHRPGTPEETLKFPSVKLFVDRVKKVRPNFEIDSKNVHAVTALCEFLEGIPLALELAAARAGVLSPEQLLGQLEDRFDFLATRQKDIPERHRTLRAAIEWSYLSLDPEAQRFFRKLTVFRGSWTLEAAQAVCSEPMALDLLEDLRDHCLIVPEPGDTEVRFRLLETLRAYGEELLSDEERREAERAHVCYYSSKATEFQMTQDDAGYSTVVPQMYTKLDNMRRALEIALDPQNPMPEEAMNIVWRLFHFWEAAGLVGEGREYGYRALSLDPTPTTTRRRTMGVISVLSWQMLDLPEALKYARMGVDLAESLGDEQDIYRAHGAALMAESACGNIKESQAIEKKVLAYVETVEGTARSLGYTNLGNAAYSAARYEDAKAYYEKALESSKRGKSERELGFSYTNLGEVALIEGDYPKAKEYFELGLAVMRRARLNLGIFECLRQLSQAAIELDEGEARAREVAMVLAAQDRMRDEVGVPITHDYVPGYTQARDKAELRLGPEAFQKAWTEGLALDVAQAIEITSRW